jgi:hypothetical protein
MVLKDKVYVSRLLLGEVGGLKEFLKSAVSGAGLKIVDHRLKELEVHISSVFLQMRWTQSSSGYLCLSLVKLALFSIA